MVGVMHLQVPHKYILRYVQADTFLHVDYMEVCQTAAIYPSYGIIPNLRQLSVSLLGYLKLRRYRKCNTILIKFQRSRCKTTMNRRGHDLLFGSDVRPRV